MLRKKDMNYRFSMISSNSAMLVGERGMGDRGGRERDVKAPSAFIHRMEWHEQNRMLSVQENWEW